MTTGLKQAAQDLERLIRGLRDQLESETSAENELRVRRALALLNSAVDTLRTPPALAVEARRTFTQLSSFSLQR